MIEVFKFFLLLGATGFGGPLSLVQLMREYYVDQKKFLVHEDFDQVFTMIKAMPGPVAFQMAVYLGQRFHGLLGGLVAGVCLLLPSFVMIVLIAAFYESMTKFVFIKYALNGFLYSVSAIILLSLKSMVMSAYRSILFWIVIFLTSFFSWYQVLPEPVLIIGFGFLVYLIRDHGLKSKNSFFSIAFLMIDIDKLLPLFKTCLYAGTFVFGTGLALLPVLKIHFVDQLHWLPLQEFNDAVIFGQMTPGPVTITASFLGYRVSGFVGALVASFGVFMMPFIHMVTWFPKAVSWLSKQTWIKSFLLGATAAVIGSIVTTVVKMNESSYQTAMFWIIFLSTFIILLWKPKISLITVIFISGFVNLLVSLATMNSV
jgi:chromate transporter